MTLEQADEVYEELRVDVEELLSDYVPDATICPNCEKMFDLTEIEWEGLVDAVTMFVIEHCGRQE